MRVLIPRVANRMCNILKRLKRIVIIPESTFVVRYDPCEGGFRPFVEFV